MYAIIVTGGKQYRVQNGDILYVEKLLAVSDDKGLTVGKPYVDVKVTGVVLKNGKSKKITVFTYKPKKSSARKMGHRQPYTKIQINAIGDETYTAEAPAEEAAEEKAE